MTHNVAVDIKCSGFLQNFGIEQKIVNNVFAFTAAVTFTPDAAHDGMACNGALDNRTSHERSGTIASGAALSGATHGRFTFQRNIVYCSWYEGSPVLLGQGGLLDSTFDRNLYWNEQPSAQAMAQRGFPCNSTRPKPGPWPGCSFQQWQAPDAAHGAKDQGSRIADPMFVDVSARDFRLKPGSPALAMGIDSLDTSTVGPRMKSDDHTVQDSADFMELFKQGKDSFSCIRLPLLVHVPDGPLIVFATATRFSCYDGGSANLAKTGRH